MSDLVAIDTEKLVKLARELEEVYRRAAIEHRRGDPDQKDYFQGKKDGTRVALTLIFELLGDTSKSETYQSLNDSTPIKRETLIGWTDSLVKNGFDLVEAIDDWQKSEGVSKWHPVCLARNSLHGRLFGAQNYLKRAQT